MKQSRAIRIPDELPNTFIDEIDIKVIKYMIKDFMYSHNRKRKYSYKIKKRDIDVKSVYESINNNYVIVYTYQNIIFGDIITDKDEYNRYKTRYEREKTLKKLI